MSRVRIHYILLALVPLLAAACTPSLAGGFGLVNTEPVAETVRTDVAPGTQGSPGIMPLTPAPTGVAVTGTAQDLQQTLTGLYRLANPSVVYIIVSSASSGSGFVYGEEGYIVTNNHVIAAGDSYEVVFASGERQRAELVGADADSDLAVLQVETLPEAVEPLALAPAGEIAVGQLAIAIGNPFGEQGSMSLGIVSGLGRSLPSQRRAAGRSTYSLPEVIQTDAPINPGNSGGPLLDLQGRVIGVNAAIASTTGAGSGVGFAIPVAAVRQIVPRLIEDGVYRYPYMGASFDSEVSLDEQQLYGVPQTQGAYIVSVAEDGPADQAGLQGADPQTGQGGDLIVAIDGRAIADFGDLNSYLVFHTQVGQTIEITALRDGERVTLDLTLGARP
jgi:2-alkenal reductase